MSLVSETAAVPVQDGSPPVSAKEMEKKTNLQQYLQAMFALLPPHHILKEVVRLESNHLGRIRYLAVAENGEETCVLGFDCDAGKTTLGLVLCLYADAELTLDGDGGFSLCSGGSQHVFKPVSVHTMWAVIQSLHKACARAHKLKHYAGGSTHQWVQSYSINSSRSCLNEWNFFPDIVSRRPPSPDQQHKPCEEEETKRRILSTLKEVMMTLDLDVVTSKDIRRKVEEELQLDLTDFKSFLDREMLTILGQMDGATQIFDHLFLGSEWNASNLEELERNGIGHILNVTREIDNFFPGQFDYLNVRVYDDEATELLKHWDRTFKYIRRAFESGSKVLVHCKMGVSRSASVVIAYAMKVKDWDLTEALQHVKDKRGCVKPNVSFMQQLEIYAGILDASRQRHNHLWRSKSETNLKQPPRTETASTSAPLPAVGITVDAPSGSSAPNSPLRTTEIAMDTVDAPAESPEEMAEEANRPKSWSPEDSLADSLFPQTPEADPLEPELTSVTNRAVCVSLRVPCSNGRTYSVSQNRAVQLDSSPPPPLPHPPPLFLMDTSTLSNTEDYSLEPDWNWNHPSNEIMECINTALTFDGMLTDETESSGCNSLPRVGSVKDRIFELEAAAASVLTVPPSTGGRIDRAGLTLNLNSNVSVDVEAPVVVQVKSAPARHQAVLVRRQPKSGGDSSPSHLDQVFEREERSQSDGSIRKHPWGAHPETSWAHPLFSPSSSSISVRKRKEHPASTGPWIGSYASDPSLPTLPSPVFDPCNRSSSISSSSSSCSSSTTTSGNSSTNHHQTDLGRERQQPMDIPPLGLVRMQREALEKATTHLTRRSLPEDSTITSSLKNHPHSGKLNRSTSETSRRSASGSVSRLRKELEAKATGSPLTVEPTYDTVASDLSTLTTRPRLTSSRRRRSASCDKMDFHSPGPVLYPSIH